MSSRHQSHRRQMYGRRQHELHQRHPAVTAREATDGLERWTGELSGFDRVSDLPEPAGGSLADLLGPRLRWAGGRG
ncbi:MAG: hypothetical protein EPN50_03410 [Chloroflexota bacterium]|nr:MAG: hypothetical protein EPN50_03410 [Chloroflexota bacterium]